MATGAMLLGLAAAGPAAAKTTLLFDVTLTSMEATTFQRSNGGDIVTSGGWVVPVTLNFLQKVVIDDFTFLPLVDDDFSDGFGAYLQHAQPLATFASSSFDSELPGATQHGLLPLTGVAELQERESNSIEFGIIEYAAGATFAGESSSYTSTLVSQVGYVRREILEGAELSMNLSYFGSDLLTDYTPGFSTQAQFFGDVLMGKTFDYAITASQLRRDMSMTFPGYETFIHDELQQHRRYWGTATLVESRAPEPSAWALMILGFGVAGARLRRVRNQRATLPAPPPRPR